MRKILTLTALLFAFLTGMAQKTKTVTIKGKVSGDTKGNDYIMFYSSSSPTDSVPVKDGKFTLKLPFTETYTQLFYTQYEKSVKRMYRPFPVLIDGSGDIHLEMDIEKGFYGASISGSPTAVAFNSFLKGQDETYKKVREVLVELYGKEAGSRYDPSATNINASRDSLTTLYMGAFVREFVAAHKNEYVGVYVLNMAGRSAMNIDQLESTLQSLSPAMQKSAEGEKMAAYIRGVKGTAIGATVKNFVLNDPEGKPVSFDQFKGKYVWIDFWASWCGPCKQAFPHMRELYAKYKDNGLEILGISADSKIEPWLKILPTLQNPWTQVWDNKNIVSEFAVTAYPTSFLIDPAGKIILKEIGYEPGGESPMDKKLAEIFGAKPGSSAGAVKKDSTGKKVMTGVPAMKVSTNQ